MYDLAIVGYGPVGATLARLMEPGVSTVVLERSTDVFPLPRAAHLDHEVMRVFQAAGVAEAVLPSTVPIRGMHFLDGVGGRKLFGFDAGGGETELGWPRGLMFYQPDLERTLRRAVADDGGVDVHLGHDVEGVVDAGDHVELQVRDLATDDVRTVTASYVVGCDGARSTVRAAAGIALDDLAFDEPWLVIDTELTAPTDLPDVCLQVCDPARPSTYVPMPGNRRRWEFMLLPGEDPAEMEQPAVFRRLLADWVDPDTAIVTRSAVYRFHALVASPWRVGRLLLAGDAAHQMPPFLGQGMCSGIRDAANLAWKLRAVLGGSPDRLLDTYESERRPHVRRIIDLAVTMGSIICTIDPEVAEARDRQFREQPDLAPTGPPGDLLPALGPGVFEGSPPAGTLFIQPVIDGARLDDLLPPGEFVTLARGDFASADLDAWFDRYGCDVVALRPDRYVFGVAKAGQADHLRAAVDAALATAAPEPN